MATTATTAPAKMRALQYDAYGEGAAGLKVNTHPTGSSFVP
jgi:hypothetical protein